MQYLSWSASFLKVSAAQVYSSSDIFLLHATRNSPVTWLAFIPKGEFTSSELQNDWHMLKLHLIFPTSLAKFCRLGFSEKSKHPAESYMNQNLNK